MSEHVNKRKNVNKIENSTSRIGAEKSRNEGVNNGENVNTILESQVFLKKNVNIFSAFLLTCGDLLTCSTFYINYIVNTLIRKSSPSFLRKSIELLRAC